jgi:hypothetical protein
VLNGSGWRGRHEKSQAELRIFRVGTDPAAKRRERHKDLQFYSVTKDPQF